MTTLTGKAPKNTYKDLLQVSNSNSGIDATARVVEDGEGTQSKLQLSTTVVNVVSGLQLNGTAAQSGDKLKHEVGGIEADISGIANGGLLVGTGAGAMGIRAGVFTDGASGFLKHEFGGLEADISTVTRGMVIGGSSAGVISLIVPSGANSFLKFQSSASGLAFGSIGTFAVLSANTFTGTQNLADNTLQRPKILDYGETVNAIGSIGGGAQDIDLESGNVVTATVDTSTTTFTFSNPPASGTAGSFTLILTNGGSQTVNWPGSVDWEGGNAPTLTAAGVDVLTFTTVDGGTIWYGFAAGLDMQ